jgi:hypothetical protein
VNTRSNDRADVGRAEEDDMSNRKQTVDGLDDIDDEDGIVEDEISEENDLTLVVETAEEVITGSDPRMEGPLNPDEVSDEDLVEEDEA